MSEYNTMSVKELKQIMAQHGIPSEGCIEKSDLIDRIQQTMNKITNSLNPPPDWKGLNNNPHIGVIMNNENDKDEEPKITKEAIEKICRDIKGAIQRLQAEYPPDKDLVGNIVASINHDKKVNEFVQHKIIPVTTQLLKRMIENNGRVSVFINLIGIIANIGAFPFEHYKAQIATDGVFQILSTLYTLINSPANSTPSDSPNFPNISKLAKISLNKVCVLLLANITISDPVTPRVLRVPNLFEMGSNGIYVLETRQPASLFLMNAAYEEIGKEFLMKSKIGMFEALADYAAATTDYDILEQIYLTFSNVLIYPNGSSSTKNKIIKAIAERKFFNTVARDIRKGNTNAFGIILNVGGKGLDFHMSLNKETMSALTDAALSKSTPSKNLDLIFGILRNCALQNNKVTEKLIEIEAETLLKRLTASPNKSISEYAQLTLSRVETVSGKVDKLEQKCSNVGCHKRGKMKKCSACGGAWYCSKECQLQDWKAVHKEFCSKIKARKETGEDSKVSRKQGDLDRTVAMKFLTEHQLDFATDAKKKGLKISQCVVVVNFTSVQQNRTSVYSIPEFYEKRINEDPFEQAGDIDLVRMRNSHAKSQTPAFIAIVIQSTTIFAFVVPISNPMVMFDFVTDILSGNMAGDPSDDEDEEDEDEKKNDKPRESDELD